MHKIDEYIQSLEEIGTIDYSLCFEMAKECSAKIDSDPIFSRRLCINVLNNWDKIPTGCKAIWNSIIEALGFYPYLSKEQITLDGFSEDIRYRLSESHFLPGKFHHDEQSNIVSKIFNRENLVVSAPTSFGKSLLIEEIVASCSYKNIVIIQPTLALLDETRKKLSKYSDRYKIIIRTTQEPSIERGNIFLFTAERVNEYELFSSVDFLVIDEFYKLSGKRDDERSSSLNNAFYKLYWNYKPQFYLLGPNIDKVSDGFLKSYNAKFYKSDYSLVDSRTIDIYKSFPANLKEKEKKEHAKNELFKLLLELKDEQTIIYCSSPNRVRKIAKDFTSFCKGNSSKRDDSLSLQEWIKSNISPTWMLLEALDYQIGIHDGALQKHITSSIIDYFNNGQLKYLFCTSTIIEGVNTSAKNVIYFDKKKGPNKIDSFDYSNIKGRAGRLMEHYVGRIYNFNPIPKNEEISIDIPLFDQNPIKDEVLVQLQTEHVKKPESKQYKEIIALPKDELAIIKRNGLSVKGQKKIIDKLTEILPDKISNFNWNGFPTYHQLDTILSLAWDYLIVEGETIRPMTKKSLLAFTSKYMKHKEESYLIKNQYDYYITLKENQGKRDADIYDDAIQFVFQTIRHWMQYKVPKWICVISELQRLVCEKKGIEAGDYIGFANLLENSFLPDNLSILVEYGIPVTAVKKLQNKLPKDIEQDNIIEYIKSNHLLDNTGLILYEKEKLMQIL